MTIAITGATSMLGVATIKNCISNNISVLTFVRKGSSKIERLPAASLTKKLMRFNFSESKIYVRPGF